MPRKSYPLTEEQRNLVDAVHKIDEETIGKLHNTLVGFNVTLGSYYVSIHAEVALSYGGSPISFLLYHSDDDDRIFNEKTMEYESWYSYIKRKFKSIQKEINAIKI